MIRPAQLEEAEEVLALWQASDAHPTITDTISAVRRLIAEQPEALLVAELEGRLVGTVIAGWDGWRGSLYRLAVLPQHRRHGLARALVEEALRRFRSRGIQRVSALVVEADQVAVAFWSSLSEIGVILDPAPKVRYVASLT
jgi:ribosomal protein S18 acetylase RimI-like enzyme